MDELSIYLANNDPCDKNKLINILNNKIIITSEHIKLIHYDVREKHLNLNIIKLFEDYGFIFNIDDYRQLLKQNGFLLKYLTDENKTEELCEIAIKSYPSSFNYVPRNMQTDKICELVIYHDWCMIKYVPYDKITDEMYEYAISKNGNLLQHVPENKKTYKLCKIAVQTNGFALKYVPDNKQTSEICAIACENMKHET